MQAVGETSPLTARKHHRSTQEALLLQSALEWLAALGLEVPTHATAADFADCWLLGRAADVVWAAQRGTEQARPRSAPPSTHHRRSIRDRINDYGCWQQLCQDLGVRADLLPAMADVEAGQHAGSLAACIEAVANQCAALGLQVPAFCGADGRGSMRRSMSRQASARRAEMFLHSGPSPPKLPAMPLLTPRAFQGRSSTPLSQGSALRNSNGSMREWMHDRKAAAGHQQQEPEQQQQPIYSGLGRTIAALERAAVQGSSLSSPLGQAGTPPALAKQQDRLDARAGQFQQAQQAQEAQAQQAQQWRRPAMPRLDVAAAMAHAAAEAAGERAVAEGEGAAGWVAQGASGYLSPLSSPGSPAGSRASTGYTSSALSSPGHCASPPVCASPTRLVAMTPSSLHLAAHANPLWSQSPEAGEAAAFPQEAAPGTGGSSAAGSSVWRSPEPAYLSSQSAGVTPASARSRSRFEHLPEAAAEAGSSPEAATPAAAAAADADGAEVSAGIGRPSMSRSLRDSFDSCGDNDRGGLLESLLSPPELKPMHTRLLGALMHTSGSGGGSRAAAAAAAARSAAAAAAREEANAGEEEEERRVRAVLVMADGEPAGVQPQVEESAQDAALPAAAPREAKQQAAAAGAATHNKGSSSRSSVRRLAMVLLGAAASAAAALAAGAMRQQRGHGSSHAGERRNGSATFRRPQPVPPLHSASHLRVMSSHTGQSEARKAAPAGGTTSSSGQPCWDNPHALLTRG